MPRGKKQLVSLLHRGAPKPRVTDTLLDTSLIGTQFVCPLLFGRDKFCKSIGKYLNYICM